ncbi:hypothetical protein RZN22_14180 [Bacillaceae bacterium S4-13-58]
MRKREVFLLSTTLFLFGMVLGFLIAPIKHGIYNFAGNNTTHNYDKTETLD